MDLNIDFSDEEKQDLADLERELNETYESEKKRFSLPPEENMELDHQDAISITRNVECPTSVNSRSFATFHDVYLKKRSENFVDLKLQRGSSKVNSEVIFIYRISFDFVYPVFNTTTKFISYGHGKRVIDAKNMSAQNIINTLEKSMKFFGEQPDRAIGLSNYRGHCYTVPALVPLLNDMNFIKILNEERKKLTSYDKKSYSIVWALYLLSKWYTKASIKGDLEIIATPTGYENKYYQQLPKNKVAIPRPRKAKPCLWIDKALMKFVKNLGSYQSKNFLTPGGAETHLFYYMANEIDIVYEKKNVSNPFNSLFQIKVQFNGYCKRCNKWSEVEGDLFIFRGYFKEKETIDLMEILDTPSKSIKNEFICQNKKGADLCQSYFDEFSGFEIIQTPYILAIGTHCHGANGIPQYTYTNYPDKIELKVNEKIERFEKYAQSRQMFKFKQEHGKKVAYAGHTWVYLKTEAEWIEVNNSSTYKVHTLPQDQLGSCLLFYRKQGEGSVYPRAGNLLPPKTDPNSYSRTD